MSDNMDIAEQRFRQSPRPLDFIRIRVYRGGMAEYLLDLLNDEQAALLEDLGKMRGEGRPEDDPGLVEVINKIRYLNNAIRDLSNGLIELVGADGSY